MTSKAVEKAMHAYLISEAETEERRAQRLRAVAAALEESLANGACVALRCVVGSDPVLFDQTRQAREQEFNLAPYTIPGYQANVLFRVFGLVGAGDAEQDFLLRNF